MNGVSHAGTHACDEFLATFLSPEYGVISHIGMQVPDNMTAAIRLACGIVKMSWAQRELALDHSQTAPHDKSYRPKYGVQL